MYVIIYNNIDEEPFPFVDRTILRYRSRTNKRGFIMIIVIDCNIINLKKFNMYRTSVRTDYVIQ